MEVVELIRSQLTWMETNPVFPNHLPQKTSVELKMELEILDLSNKVVAIFHTTVDKIVEKCNELYRIMSATHNRCQALASIHIPEYPGKEKHLNNLQDKLQGDEQSIQKVESINGEVIGTWVA